jgi:hypothetical protein
MLTAISPKDNPDGADPAVTEFLILIFAMIMLAYL